MSEQTRCAGCNGRIDPWQDAAYVERARRSAFAGDVAPDPDRLMYHREHVPGLSKTLWHGKLRDWPGLEAL